MKVFKNAAGEVVNIGEWDFNEQPVKRTEPLHQAKLMEFKFKGLDPNLIYDEEGNVITEITNPIPEGVTEHEEEVTTFEDGARCLVSDYTKLRNYPPIEEQLDYIYHYSVEKWKADIIQPIKDANPKS
tara:strand:- start:72 stop:455 length:384 start_codon:yes stop_codon:yes gene_type:complete